MGVKKLYLYDFVIDGKTVTDWTAHSIEEVEAAGGFNVREFVSATEHAPVSAVGELIQAAINLVNVKGRHHSEIAMNRLIDAVKAYREQSK